MRREATTAKDHDRPGKNPPKILRACTKPAGGNQSRQQSPLLPLPAPLPHRRGPGGFCFISRQRGGGKTLHPGLAAPSRALQVKSHREKNRSSFPPRSRVFLWATAGWQNGMCFFWPELGYTLKSLSRPAPLTHYRRRRRPLARQQTIVRRSPSTYNEPTLGRDVTR